MQMRFINENKVPIAVARGHVLATPKERVAATGAHKMGSASGSSCSPFVPLMQNYFGNLPPFCIHLFLKGSLKELDGFLVKAVWPSLKKRTNDRLRI